MLPIVIKAVHITELRTALAAVFSAVSAPAWSYASTPTVGGMIQATHVNELRTAIAFLGTWSACNEPPTGLSPSSTTAPGSGKIDSTVLSYTAGCTFTTTSNAPWLKILDASTTIVRYVVDPNSTLAPRTGTITIGGLTFTVSQNPGDEVVSYLDSDATGSVRMVTDVSGNVVSRFDYLPFGIVWSGPDPTNEKRLFDGMERDQVTNLDYFSARSLSLNIGRFTSPDGSFFADPSNPQSWNPYSFALNNPLTFVDPSGHDACDPSAQGSGGATFYTGVCQQLPSFFSDQPWFFENGLGPFNDWFFQQSPAAPPKASRSAVSNQTVTPSKKTSCFAQNQLGNSAPAFARAFGLAKTAKALDYAARPIEALSIGSLGSDFYAASLKAVRTGIGGSANPYASGINLASRGIADFFGSSALKGKLVAVGDVATIGAAFVGSFASAYDLTVAAECATGFLK